MSEPRDPFITPLDWSTATDTSEMKRVGPRKDDPTDRCVHCGHDATLDAAQPGLDVERLAGAMYGCCNAAGTVEHAEHVLARLAAAEEKG